MTFVKKASMCLLLLCAGFSLTPAQAENSNSDLAKKTQNPISDLISVPIQSGPAAFSFSFYFLSKQMIRSKQDDYKK